MSIGRFLRAFAVALGVLAATVSTAAADRRIALLVAQSAYSEAVGPLKNPPNDVQRMRTALLKAGFASGDIRIASNVSRVALLREVEDFAQRAASLGPGDIAFFYYSGHGAARSSTRENFLIPIDAERADGNDLWLQSVRVDEAMEKITRASTAAIFILIDACRNELRLPPTGKDVSGEKSFGAVPSQAGALISFAADDGQRALQGWPAVPGDVSPYAAAVAEAITTPGLNATAAFQQVRIKVNAWTGGRQQPVFQSKLNADPVFVFASSEPSKPGRVAARPDPGPSPAVSATLPDARRLAARIDAPVLGSGQRPGNFSAFRDCRDCLDMVALPGGRFTMGSPPGEVGRDNTEDQLDITLAAFAISRFPVTRGQYAVFATTTGRGVPPGCWTDRAAKGVWAVDPQGSWADPGFTQSDRHPVMCVSWDDAFAFARWMSERTGRAYRLLSEAEYEFATRGGTTTTFWWGARPDGSCRNANGLDAAAKRTFTDRPWTFASCDDGWARASPVGSYAANPFGLFDMTGNVWSWTADCYNQASALRPRDGRPDASGDCAARALRGGSWSYSSELLRSAYRGGNSADTRSSVIGFRLARDLSPSDR